MTENTQLLLAEYLNKSSPVALAYNELLETERYQLTLHPAGHCLGSAQVLVESKISGERLLYTEHWYNRSRPLALRDQLKNGTWGGGPWGLGVRPQSALAEPKYRAAFGLYVRLGLTCKCAGSSTHSKKSKFFISSQFDDGGASIS